MGITFKIGQKEFPVGSFILMDSAGGNSWLGNPTSTDKPFLKITHEFPCVPVNKMFKSEIKDLAKMIFLVSTYVVCDRLSVMQRLPESGKANFVLKLARTPCYGIWYKTPPPPSRK